MLDHLVALWNSVGKEDARRGVTEPGRSAHGRSPLQYSLPSFLAAQDALLSGEAMRERLRLAEERVRTLETQYRDASNQLRDALARATAAEGALAKAREGREEADRKQTAAAAQLLGLQTQIDTLTKQVARAAWRGVDGWGCGRLLAGRREKPDRGVLVSHCSDGRGT